MPIPSADPEEDGLDSPPDEAVEAESPKRDRADTEQSAELVHKRARFATDFDNFEGDADDGPMLIGILKAHDVGKLDRRSKYDVCGVFSTPWLTASATTGGLRGGWSLYLA